MIGSWVALVLLLWELFLSSLVHLVYGLYIFSYAVAGDFSEALSSRFRKGNLVNFEAKTVGPMKSLALPSSSNLPPIVLVHGIFGFGKGVRT